ncbi:MAG: cytochrome-c peroxidase [Acidobacteria bacterium]|nr:cytochrome-c peroxidase [Acidobacteriota bacterium]
MRNRVALLALGTLTVAAGAAWFTGATMAQTRQTRATVEAASSADLEELGRLLFWDPVLSGARDVACATCHHPDFAYADGRDISLGVGAVGLGPARVDKSGGRIPVVKRNSQTILNTGYNGIDGRRRRRGGGDRASTAPASAPMFWDSRVRSLETQALEPIKALEEMRGTSYPEDKAVDVVVERLRALPEYVTRFEHAFGAGTPINAAQLSQALAAFERSLVAMDSPFDRSRAGDTDALAPQQRRGFDTFDDVGCDRCHRGTMFSDFDLEAEGVAEHPLLSVPDAGDGRFRFRTPSLRNVALTAPYMHNGTLATLEDVLRFYDNGRSENPNVSNDPGRNGDGAARVSRSFRRVDDMSEREMQDIVAFLESLSDTNFDRTIPAHVPSGLPPGGFIGSH